jgi:hypothetical protein
MAERSSINALSLTALPAILCAAAYRQQHAVLACKRHRRHDIGGAGAARDQRGPTVDGGVPDFARFVVVGIGRADDLASHRRLKGLDRIVRNLDHV